MKINRFRPLLLVAAVVITVLLVASCGGTAATTTPITTTQPPTTTTTTTPPTTTTTQPPTTTTTQPPTTTTPTPTPTTTIPITTTTQPPTTTTTQPPTTTPGESLEEILGRAAGIVTVKYDMVMTSPGSPTMTTTVWMKNNKMRTETTVEGETVIMLMDIDAQTMYMYYPDQNMAIKMTFEMPETAVGEAESVPDYNPVIIGTETLDGKVCLVVEYTVEGSTTKMWIWKEKGFPIRIESETPDGTVVIEYKNIDFGDIPDSMFELPAGVEIMEIPGM